MDMFQKCKIVTGGNINRQFLMNELKQDKTQCIISVDSGANSLYAINTIPKVLIGDFDSVNQDVLGYYQSLNVDIVSYPPEKNMTDTAIAIEYAINRGAQEIIIYGSIGSRFDHTLCNVFLLEKYIQQAKIIIKNTHNEIYMFKGLSKIQLNKNNFKFISLLPITDQVKSVTTKGLKYELNRYTMLRSDSLGISNELMDNTCSISFEEGVLLVIRSRD